MNKLFSEMIEDEVCNSNYKFLQSISSELKSILYENAYLKAENKMLREENERYIQDIQNQIKEHDSFVGELLTSFVNK